MAGKPIERESDDKDESDLFALIHRVWSLLSAFQIQKHHTEPHSTVYTRLQTSRQNGSGIYIAAVEAQQLRFNYHHRDLANDVVGLP